MMKLWCEFTKFLKSILGSSTVEKWISELQVEKFDEKNIFLIAKDAFQIIWFNEHILPIAYKKLLTKDNKPYKIHLRQKNEKFLNIKKSEKKLVSSQYKILPLSENFTFDSFITSQKTLLTYKIFKQLSQSFSKKTQESYLDANPVYVFGESGSGKTHLLQAYAQALKQAHLNPLYITSNLFTEHFVKALRSNNISIFRKFYRSFDALVVDNIEIFSHKLATQEEFFHTFNIYHAQQKPIILSSSLSPKELIDIEPRLISRFEWGLVLTLSLLPRSSLKNFIDIKEKQYNLSLDMTCKNYLLHHTSHLKDLSKILQMLAYKKNLPYENTPLISVETIKPFVQKMAEISKQHFSNDHLIKKISEYFHLTKESLLSPSKTKSLVYPRRLCIYFMRVYGKQTLTNIGKYFSKDHSTVITCIKDITNKLSNQEPLVENDIKNILQLVTTPSLKDEGL